MGMFLYEKTFGCYSYWDSLPYVQEWAILLQSDMGHSIEVHGHGFRWTTLIWKIMMSFNDIGMKVISNIFFHTMLGVSNIRYSKFQEIAFEHEVKEQCIKQVFREVVDVSLDSNKIDLQHKWLTRIWLKAL